MEKPEKRWKLTNMEHERKQEIFNHETDGYNQACDECDKYHKQVLTELADEGKIKELLYTSMRENENWGDFCNKVSKKLSEYIKDK